MKIKDTLIVLFIVGAMSLVANAIGTKYTIVEAIPGLLFLIFLAIAGVILAKYLPGRIPAVAYIVTLGKNTNCCNKQNAFNFHTYCPAVT